MACPVIAATRSNTFPTPATLAELQALLPAEPAEGTRVLLTLTPALVRQILARNDQANPIVFGGPLPAWVLAGGSQDWYRGVRVQAVANVVRLAEIIVSGRFDPDFPEPGWADSEIRLSPNLQIGNGRHRLKAVDLADLPITVYVARCHWGEYMGPPLGLPC